MTIPNRIMLAPMNQNVANEGFADDYLLVHLGKFALAGFGVIMTKATAIERDARIAPGDLGIWSDDHIPGPRRVCGFLHGVGAITSIQPNHCGRKGSSQRPWQGFGPLNEEDAKRGEMAGPLVSSTAEALGPGHDALRAGSGRGRAPTLASPQAALLSDLQRGRSPRGLESRSLGRPGPGAQGARCRPDRPGKGKIGPHLASGSRNRLRMYRRLANAGRPSPGPLARSGQVTYDASAPSSSRS